MTFEAITPQRIAGIRKALGLTQERLAHLLSVTWTTVSRWEAGSSSPTGMPLRLLYVLEDAARDREFRASLNDPRARDPLFALYSLLGGVYGTGRKVGRRKVLRRSG